MSAHEQDWSENARTINQSSWPGNYATLIYFRQDKLLFGSVSSSNVAMENSGSGSIWGRMSIVDTKPFMLPAVRHSIFGHKLQEQGTPA
jgi:hypothetical protein